MKISAAKFGKNLLSHRTSQGLTQQKLAEKSGLTGMWLSHFENGKRLPSLGNFCKLCNALNVPPQNLLIP